MAILKVNPKHCSSNPKTKLAKERAHAAAADCTSIFIRAPCVLRVARISPVTYLSIPFGVAHNLSDHGP